MQQQIQMMPRATQLQSSQNLGQKIVAGVVAVIGVEADHIGPAPPQRLRQGVWLVVEALGCRENAFACRNGDSVAFVPIQYSRDGRLRQSQFTRDIFGRNRHLLSRCSANNPSEQSYAQYAHTI